MRTLLFVLLLLLAPGCGLFQSLDVRSYAHTAEPPSNVAVYLAVSDGKDPVTDLTEQSFSVSENEQPLNNDAIQLTLLDRDAVAVHHTLLLADISQAKDQITRRQIARGAAGFVSRVRKNQGVTVYAYDGAADLILIGDYPRGGSEALQELEKLTATTPRDPSRNLNGAILQGMKELDARLMREKKRVRIGTLVILTGGPDLAGRASAEEVQTLLDSTSYHSVAVGAGVPEDFDLEGIGRNGTTEATSMTMAGIGLEEAATRVDALYGMYYLVQYCSPARAGMRRLKLEAMRTTLEGDEQSGSVELDFDATGFGPGCDPKKPPRFVGQAAADTRAGPDPAEPGADEPKQPPAQPSPGEPSPEEPDDGTIVPPPAKPGFAPPEAKSP